MVRMVWWEHAAPCSTSAIVTAGHIIRIGCAIIMRTGYA